MGINRPCLKDTWMPRYPANPPKVAPSPNTRTFLIPKEVAGERHTTEESLARERAAGDGPPFYKIGSRVLYDRDDLDAWYAERRHNCEAE
jgi:hypothetical protein